MAKRGVFQLKELTLHYCRRGGSSEGTRQFIERDLAAWKAKNPQIEIRTQERNGRHPYLHGAYLHRREKTLSIKSFSSDEVEDTLQELRANTGRKPPASKQLKKWWFSNNPSIQGMWRPDMFGKERKQT